MTTIEWTPEEWTQWIASAEDDADIREAWRRQAELATEEGR